MGKGFRIVTSLLLLFFVFPGAKASTQPIEEEKDITTPLATNPTTSEPTVVPNSDSDASAVVTTPLTVPTPPRVAAHPGESWCVARENAPKIALQAALDYACGIGGADCSEIQEGGKCYNPNSLIAHASFAFNSYYQKNPIPSSCNFGESAVTISGDPSVGSCHFPSTRYRSLENRLLSNNNNTRICEMMTMLECDNCSTNESTLNVSEDGLGLFGRIPSHPTPKPEASSSSSRTFSHLYFHSHLLCFLFLYHVPVVEVSACHGAAARCSIRSISNSSNVLGRNFSPLLFKNMKQRFSSFYTS
uniref:X8 domain-containing protein n=1 Tax=Brassica campestris TaxID=3711 RepID=A0A3P6CVH9_BRACM|nr:unnamed protein product [Brassica rapa]